MNYKGVEMPLERALELAHHGVKGQKHGERKYQYEDGSLTPLGRIHYGVGKKEAGAKKEEPKEKKPTKEERSAARKSEKAIKKAEKEKARREKILSNKKLLYKHANEFSEAEINKALSKFSTTDRLRESLRSEEQQRISDKEAARKLKMQIKRDKLAFKSEKEKAKYNEKVDKLDLIKKQEEANQLEKVAKEKKGEQSANKWKNLATKLTNIVAVATTMKTITSELGISDKSKTGDSMFGSIGAALGLRTPKGSGSSESKSSEPESKPKPDKSKKGDTKQKQEEPKKSDSTAEQDSKPKSKVEETLSKIDFSEIAKTPITSIWKSAQSDDWNTLWSDTFAGGARPSKKPSVQSTTEEPKGDSKGASDDLGKERSEGAMLGRAKSLIDKHLTGNTEAAATQRLLGKKEEEPGAKAEAGVSKSDSPSTALVVKDYWDSFKSSLGLDAGKKSSFSDLTKKILGNSEASVDKRKKEDQERIAEQESKSDKPLSVDEAISETARRFKEASEQRKREEKARVQKEMHDEFNDIERELNKLVNDSKLSEREKISQLDSLNSKAASARSKHIIVEGANQRLDEFRDMTTRAKEKLEKSYEKKLAEKSKKDANKADEDALEEKRQMESAASSSLGKKPSIYTTEYGTYIFDGESKEPVAVLNNRNYDRKKKLMITGGRAYDDKMDFKEAIESLSGSAADFKDLLGTSLSDIWKLLK